MNHLKALLLLVILGHSSLLAQKNMTLKGAIVSTENQPVAAGNILLISPLDSSLIQGSFFTAGNFQINIPGSYQELILNVSALGFQEYSQLIKIDSANEVLALKKIILLTNNVLTGVTVVGAIPLFEKLDNGLNVNIDKTILSASSSFIELVSKVPGVLIIDDRITIIGKGEPLIFLDKQRIPSEQLSAISVSQIKSIKIIEHPSAKYDADGQAVLQIITKKTSLDGYKMSVRQLISFSRYLYPTTSFNLSSKVNQWSLTAAYEFKIGRDKWIDERIDFEIPARFLFSEYESQNVHRNQGKHIYHLGLSRNIGASDYFSIKYSGNAGSSKPDITSITRQIIESNPIRTSARNIGLHQTLFNSYNVNYFKVMDSLQSSLFFGLQYSDFGTDKKDNITDITDASPTKYFTVVSGSNDIRIFSSKVDYEKRFKNKIIFQAGGKYALTNTAGMISTIGKTEDDPAFQSIDFLSNDFKYRESNLAAYVQASKRINQSKLLIGLRAVYSNLDGSSNKQNGSIIDSSFILLLPNVDWTYKINDAKSFQLNYKSSITRPQFNQLDPFLVYASNFVAFQGNPELTNSFTHGVTASFKVKQLNIKLGYAKIFNLINRSNVFYPELGTVVFLSENFQPQERYFAAVEYSHAYKRWRGYSLARINYHNQFSDNKGPKGNPVPYLYFYTNQSFRVSSNSKLELSGLVRSRYDDGIKAFGGLATFNLGLNASFFNRKIDCILAVDDIFNSMIITNRFDLNGIRSDGHWQYSTRIFKFAVTYHFGKLKSGKFKNQVIDKEETNRIDD